MWLETFTPHIHTSIHTKHSTVTAQYSHNRFTTDSQHNHNSIITRKTQNNHNTKTPTLNSQLNNHNQNSAITAVQSQPELSHNKPSHTHRQHTATTIPKSQRRHWRLRSTGGGGSSGCMSQWRTYRCQGHTEADVTGESERGSYSSRAFRGSHSQTSALQLRRRPAGMR